MLNRLLCGPASIEAAVTRKWNKSSIPCDLTNAAKTKVLCWKNADRKRSNRFVVYFWNTTSIRFYLKDFVYGKRSCRAPLDQSRRRTQEDATRPFLNYSSTWQTAKLCRASVIPKWATWIKKRVSWKSGSRRCRPRRMWLCTLSPWSPSWVDKSNGRCIDDTQNSWIWEIAC